MVYVVLFVLCLIVTKYGLLGFILSKTVKHHFGKEMIDSLITFALLTAIFLLNKERMVHISNHHFILNLVYTVIAVVLYYAVNIVVGEKLAGQKSNNQARIEGLTEAVPFWLSLISTGILAPLFEEVIFRFYLQDTILGNTVLALLLSSALFALMHMVSGFTFSGFITYMGASLVVGSLYMLSGGLLFSSVMHIVVNSLAVVFMYYGGALKEKYKDDDDKNSIQASETHEL